MLHGDLKVVIHIYLIIIMNIINEILKISELIIINVLDIISYGSSDLKKKKKKL